MTSSLSRLRSHPLKFDRNHRIISLRVILQSNLVVKPLLTRQILTLRQHQNPLLCQKILLLDNPALTLLLIKLKVAQLQQGGGGLVRAPPPET